MADGGPESIGEVARLLKAFQEHSDRQAREAQQHADRRFDSLDKRIAELGRDMVSSKEHGLHVGHTNHQLESLRSAIAEERQARVEAVAHEAREREKAAEGNKERIKALGVTARWSITVSVAILGVFLTILFRGGIGG